MGRKRTVYSRNHFALGTVGVQSRLAFADLQAGFQKNGACYQKSNHGQKRNTGKRTANVL
jgi:hypothetical protein